MIKTSSWFTKLPADHTRIGISRQVPSGSKASPTYRALCPGPWFKSVSPQEYAKRYFAILADLDPQTVVAELEDLAGGLTATLLCWEAPPPSPSWCHRGLVSAWLYEELGLEVPEFGHEGFGWQHPKLEPELRRCR